MAELLIEEKDESACVGATVAMEMQKWTSRMLEIQSQKNAD